MRRNNRIYVCGRCGRDILERISSVVFFDRYASFGVWREMGCFVPIHDDKPSIVRMLGCSTVFAPRDWRYDRQTSRLLYLAEFFGKPIIYGEDSRC